MRPADIVSGFLYRPCRHGDVSLAAGVDPLRRLIASRHRRGATSTTTPTTGGPAVERQRLGANIVHDGASPPPVARDPGRATHPRRGCRTISSRIEQTNGRRRSRQQAVTE